MPAETGFQLRQDEAAYGDNFEGKKNRLSLENTRFLELFFYPSTTSFGPTRCWRCCYDPMLLCCKFKAPAITSPTHLLCHRDERCDAGTETCCVEGAKAKKQAVVARSGDPVSTEQRKIKRAGRGDGANVVAPFVPH